MAWDEALHLFFIEFKGKFMGLGKHMCIRGCDPECDDSAKKRLKKHGVTFPLILQITTEISQILEIFVNVLENILKLDCKKRKNMNRKFI